MIAFNLIYYTDDSNSESDLLDQLAPFAFPPTGAPSGAPVTSAPSKLPFKPDCPFVIIQQKGDGLKGTPYDGTYQQQANKHLDK